MIQQNEFQRGYDAAYDEIRTAMRDNDHPSVFVCPCPACEVISELLEGLADTMNFHLTEDESELFRRLLQLAEDRQDISNWPDFSIAGSSSRFGQKMIPE